jgi:hypothetical protein
LHLLKTKTVSARAMTEGIVGTHAGDMIGEITADKPGVDVTDHSFVVCRPAHRVVISPLTICIT